MIYDVTSRGRARVTEVRTEPAEFTDIEKMVQREIQRRVYRPVVIDGDTWQSDPQIFTHEFTYTRAELEAMRTPQVEGEQTAAKEE